jgi:riboflavin synthase
MFTGIIQAVGQVKKIERFENDNRIVIDANTLPLHDVNLGDSIAVNGVCLTVIELGESFFSVDVSSHTLEKTTFNKFEVGRRVNLEKCVQPNSYLSGHWVLGHVDGIATLAEKNIVGRSNEWIWELPDELLPFIAIKGSLTIDGISLTVNALEGNKVGVTLIPHTTDVTALSDLIIGDKVNIEVDVIARYVARWLSSSESSKKSALEKLEIL